jgi:carbon monoxide dehydrogenase subunit G
VIAEKEQSLNVPPVGKISLKIIEREEPKTIKFETLQSPMPFNLWIQLLPVTESSSKMKLTIKADMNPFLKMMVAKPLQEGIEKIADMLAMAKYE